MSGPAIFFCTDPVGNHWQLGKVSSTPLSLALVGWSGFLSIDAGVPEKVARVLARALCDLGTVSFLASQIPEGIGLRVSSRLPDSVVALEQGPGGTRSQYLVHTRDPDVALAAFEDPGAPWWLQGQMLLVTLPGGPFPELIAPQLAALLSDDWLEAVRDLDLVVVARPGVDGDIVGIATRYPSKRKVVLEALRREALSANVRVETVSEEQFAEMLAK